MKNIIIHYVLLAILFLVLAGFIYYVYRSSITSNEEIEKIAEHAVAVKIQENTALFNKRFDELNDVLVKSIKARNQQITDIGIAVSELTGVVRKNSEGLKSYKAGTGDINEQYSTFVHMKDENGKDFPIGFAIFKPNRKEGERWTTGPVPGWQLYNQVLLTEGKEKDAVVSSWFENPLRKDTKGKKFPLHISDVEWVRKEIKTKSFKMNPTLTLGFTSEIDNFYPTLDVGLFTYGKTENDFDWRFIAGGIGYGDDYEFEFVPVQYNIGKHIPLIKNFLIGPAVNIDSEGYDFGIGGHCLF